MRRKTYAEGSCLTMNGCNGPKKRFSKVPGIYQQDARIFSDGIGVASNLSDGAT